MVSKCAHRCDSRALLATAHRASTDEQPCVFAPVGTGLPLTTSLIPEDLPLSREVAVSCWNAEEERIVLLERLWVGERWDVGILWRCMHLLQHFLRKRLCDLIEVDATAGFLDALGLSFSELCDVAPCGVLRAIQLAWSSLRYAMATQYVVPELRCRKDSRRRSQSLVPLC